MFRICAVFLVFVISSYATAEDGENGSSLTGWVEGTSTESGESSKIFFGPESDPQSEIVLRNLKDVSVHCQADYPVQLDFESHTGFRLLATGSGSSSRFFSNGTHELDVQQHTNYAHLVSLKEAYTGLYICKGRGSKTNNHSISIYIYVPTENIFVSTKTAMISADHSPLVIPCPIADPDATVALVKLDEQENVKSVTNGSYNPRVGFTLEKTSGGDSNDTNVDGTYYCIAKTKQNHRAVEFTVVKGPVECTRRCLENAKCQLVNEQQVCECKPTYTETFVSEKCLKPCKTDKDCPSNLACMPQESNSFLLEILSSAEGRSTSSSISGERRSTFSSVSEERRSTSTSGSVDRRSTSTAGSVDGRSTSTAGSVDGRSTSTAGSVDGRSTSSSGSAEGKSTSSSGSEEDEENDHHEKHGECKHPCIYRTTSCSLGASRNIDEVCRVEEHKAVCKV